MDKKGNLCYNVMVSYTMTERNGTHFPEAFDRLMWRIWI